MRIKEKYGEITLMVRITKSKLKIISAKPDYTIFSLGDFKHRYNLKEEFIKIK